MPPVRPGVYRESGFSPTASNPEFPRFRRSFCHTHTRSPTITAPIRRLKTINPPLTPRSSGERCHARFPLQPKNTNSSPRPRNGGEGSGVRGTWHPCHRNQIRESRKQRTPTNPCDSSVKIRVHPWRKNTPHPCSSVAQQNQLPGELHPSPPAPLPFQGRGVPCAPATAAQKHKFLPSPPQGERGRG